MGALFKPGFFTNDATRARLGRKALRVPRLSGIMAGLLMLGGTLAAVPAAAPPPGAVRDTDIFINAGDPANDARMTYGWGRIEGRPGSRIRWINKLEADVTVDIEKPQDMDFWLRGTPVFRQGARQVVGVYVNLDFVSRWVLPYTVGANDYHTILPARVLKPGANRITLRLGYIMRPGNDRRKLGMEVEHLLLRPR